MPFTPITASPAFAIGCGVGGVSGGFTGAGVVGATGCVGVAGVGATGATGCTGLFLVTKALKASFHCEFFMSRACCASVSSNQDFFLIMSRAIAIVLS